MLMNTNFGYVFEIVRYAPASLKLGRIWCATQPARFRKSSPVLRRWGEHISRCVEHWLTLGLCWNQLMPKHAFERWILCIYIYIYIHMNICSEYGQLFTFKSWYPDNRLLLLNYIQDSDRSKALCHESETLLVVSNWTWGTWLLGPHDIYILILKIRQLLFCSHDLCLYPLFFTDAVILRYIVFFPAYKISWGHSERASTLGIAGAGCCCVLF